MKQIASSAEANQSYGKFGRFKFLGWVVTL